MAYQLIGYKLEQAISSYISGLKGSLLSGVQIGHSLTTDVINPPFLRVFAGSVSPWSDSDRRGELRGPKRVVLQVMIGEHMDGTSIQQYCGEFENIISEARRIGKVNASTTASASFVLNYAVPGTTPSFLAANDVIRINGTNRTISSVSAGSGTLYNITLTESVTLTANTPVFMQSVTKRGDEYTDLIAECTESTGAYKPDTGLEIIGMRFVTCSPSTADDMRLMQYEFEIDALNCDDLT